MMEFGDDAEWERLAMAECERLAKRQKRANLKETRCFGNDLVWWVFRRVLRVRLDEDLCLLIVALAFPFGERLRGMNWGQSVFLSHYFGGSWSGVSCLHGPGGVGKSHALRALREDPGVVMTAATGTVALQNGGITVHEFLGLGLDMSEANANKKILSHVLKIKGMKRVPRKLFWMKDIKEKWEGVKTLIVDEASMVSAEVLCRLDWVLRRVRGQNESPFGGVKVIFVCDFGQLGPQSQSKPLFLQRVWVEEWRPRVFELVEPMRHSSDLPFFSALCRIRMGEWDEEIERMLMSRTAKESPPDAVQICARKADRDRVNTKRLLSLSGPNRIFERREERVALDIAESNTLSAVVQQKRLSDQDAEARRLALRPGCDVIFTVNIRHGPPGIRNGTMGKVVGFWKNDPTQHWRELEGLERFMCSVEDTTDVLPVVEYGFKGRQLTVVVPFCQHVRKFEVLHPETGKKVGCEQRLHQLPLQNGPAVTIHVAQGKTFEKVSVLGPMDFTGQGYVAISRVRALSGLTLIVDQQSTRPRHWFRANPSFISAFSQPD